MSNPADLTAWVRRAVLDHPLVPEAQLAFQLGVTAEHVREARQCAS